MDLNKFLVRNRISSSDWESADIDWEILKAIAYDHQAQHERLQITAEFMARVVQRFTGVHSVRWRIKDTEHLIRKIIRKRVEKREINPSIDKYRSIDKDNYFTIVSDLVGVRALHLFKDECFSIDLDLKKMQETWIPIENTIAYVREGDPPDLETKFKENGFEVKPHPAGYRSVHYVLQTQLLQRKVLVELQVRTIFEEGWSEIDHQVRYPNISNDPLVAYFLTIFNRLAGSADEMGTFVQNLTGELRKSQLQVAEANKEREEALSAMDRMIGEIKQLKQQDDETSRKLTELQQEVAKLRNINPLVRLPDAIDTNVLGSLGGALVELSRSKYPISVPIASIILKGTSINPKELVR